MIQTYRALFVAQIQAAAQYRVQSVLWMLFSVIRPVIFLAAWVAVANAQGGQIGSYDTRDFAGYYVALALVTNLTFSWNAYDFEFEIRMGRLSPKLLRPLHPIHYAVVQNVVWKAATLPALLPALVLIGWSFGAHFSASPGHLALFVPSLLLAAALRYMYTWLLATLAFWTTRIHAIMSLQDRVNFVFAGTIAPLSLLPAGPLQLIAAALPFGFMLAVPAEILRGGPDLEQTLRLMLGQAVWLAAVSLAFLATWRIGLREYSAVGA